MRYIYRVCVTYNTTHRSLLWFVVIGHVILNAILHGELRITPTTHFPEVRLNQINHVRPNPTEMAR